MRKSAARRPHKGAAQIGTFSLGQRAATVVLRGSQFFTVGFLSSLLGHGLTVYLVTTSGVETSMLLPQPW